MESVSSSCVLVVTLTLCFSTSLYVEGVRFRVNGGSFFTTTEPININDVVTTSEDIANGLICQSDRTTTEANLWNANWFLHPENQTTAESDKILSGGDRGWSRIRNTTDSNYKQGILRRQPPETALEGRFTCRITEDSNPIKSIYVLYPISSVIAHIVVVSARNGEFRVQCSSIGGRALSMAVSGPDGYSSDITESIRPVGTPTMIGSDEYSASTSVVLGGNHRDEYECTVRGSTSNTDSVRLKVASAPVIESLERTAPDTVRVVWSGPTGGARVTRYIIRYTESSGSVGTEAASAGSNSTDITGLTDGETYTISVQARSGHLSGESEEMTITLEPPPAAPEGVMMGTVDSTTSVTVSWEAVTGADRYTVTFTRATGADQLGGCPRSSHTASVSVDTPTTTTSISIGHNVESAATDMLRAYSTYLITVVALSNSGGSSENSDQIAVMTPQTGASIHPENIVVTVDSSTRIFVEWKRLGSPCRAINGIITSYIIRYAAKLSGMAQTVQTEDLDITLIGLTPFTNYSIQIAAVNEEGDVGVYSEAEYVMTDEDIPGPVGDITSIPSFFMITITWEKPEVPNGIITKYEVIYGPRGFPQFTITEDVKVGTTFTTPDDLERGAEYTFTVTAHTSVGPGEPTTAHVATLDRPPAVEGVRVESLNDSSVTVSWDALTIPGHPIDNYTVVYSPVSQQRRKRQEEEEEEEMVFPGTVTSAVITGLDSSVNYQFQVFATVILNGQSLEGERSTAEATTRNVDSESDSSRDSSAPLIIGVVFGLIGVAVGVSGLVLAVAMFRKRAKGESEVSTENNLAYGLSGPYKKRAESKGDYEIPEYIQPSPPAVHTHTAQETVHETL